MLPRPEIGFNEKVRIDGASAACIHWTSRCMRNPSVGIGYRKARIRATSEHSSSPLLRRQRPHKASRPFDPPLELLLVVERFRPDEHPALHRPAGDVER